MGILKEIVEHLDKQDCQECEYNKKKYGCSFGHCKGDIEKACNMAIDKFVEEVCDGCKKNGKLSSEIFGHKCVIKETAERIKNESTM